MQQSLFVFPLVPKTPRSSKDVEPVFRCIDADETHIGSDAGRACTASAKAHGVAESPEEFFTLELEHE